MMEEPQVKMVSLMSFKSLETNQMIKAGHPFVTSLRYCRKYETNRPPLARRVAVKTETTVVVKKEAKVVGPAETKIDAPEEFKKPDVPAKRDVTKKTAGISKPHRRRPKR